jgi:LPXTG-motif cell wall-anchored protein
MTTDVHSYGHSVVERPPKPLRRIDSQDFEKFSRKLQETACVVLLDDMSARKSLTTAALASVAFFSLFGAQAAHAAPGGNGNGNGQIGSIGIGPAPVDLHNDEAETKNDCPSDDAWWHFVLAPNNGQYAFTSMNLNIGGSTTLISGADIVANGGQTDNVFVAVPEGASLDDLSAAGSSAMVDPYSPKVKFVLSHVCEGDEVIEEEPVAEEEVTEDEIAVEEETTVEDEKPVSDKESVEEETTEDDVAADEPSNEVIINSVTPDPDTNDPTTDIVTPEPNTDDPTTDEQDNPTTDTEDVITFNESADNNEPSVEDDPEKGNVDENTNDSDVNSNDEVVKAASIVETTPDTEVAPSLNVTADDTDHNALPATGMELSLAFLGLGLAGIGGTLLAVRRRLMIK